jgi:hypothetical protein
MGFTVGRSGELGRNLVSGLENNLKEAGFSGSKPYKEPILRLNIDLYLSTRQVPGCSK